MIRREITLRIPPLQIEDTWIVSPVAVELTLLICNY